MKVQGSFLLQPPLRLQNEAKKGRKPFPILGHKQEVCFLLFPTILKPQKGYKGIAGSPDPPENYREPQVSKTNPSLCGSNTVAGSPGGLQPISLGTTGLGCNSGCPISVCPWQSPTRIMLQISILAYFSKILLPLA